MPKRKRRNYNAPTQPTDAGGTMPVKPWVKWVALLIVAVLGVSVLAGAIAATPAHAQTRAQAAEATATPAASAQATDGNYVADTDGDGIDNSVDPDIDGDGIVNGLDNDIDGDGIVNSQDGDPAATNGNDNAQPPIIADGVAPEESPWGTYVTVGSAFALLAAGVVTLLLKRKKKAKN